jgi:hypothetical protein
MSSTRALVALSHWTAALLIAYGALGCATPGPPPPIEQLVSQDLGYLVDGSTTREQAALRLGLPSRSFEADRILIYRMTRLEGGTLQPAAWDRPLVAGYDLVLVFDGQGVLERHALVPK